MCWDRKNQCAPRLQPALPPELPHHHRSPSHSLEGDGAFHPSLNCEYPCNGTVTVTYLTSIRSPCFFHSGVFGGRRCSPPPTPGSLPADLPPTSAEALSTQSLQPEARMWCWIPWAPQAVTLTSPWALPSGFVWNHPLPSIFTPTSSSQHSPPPN